MRNLGRAECMQPECGVAPFQFAKEILVKLNAQLRVKSSLYQQLVATQSQRLVDLLAILFDGGYECTLLLVRLAVDVAELATRNADVRYVYVAVDLPRYDRRVVDRLAAQAVGRLGQFGQRRIVKCIGLVAGQRLAVEAFFVKVVQSHFSFTSSKSRARRRRSVAFTRTRTLSPNVYVLPCDVP